jgi:hypothetical protein
MRAAGIAPALVCRVIDSEFTSRSRRRVLQKRPVRPAIDR